MSKNIYLGDGVYLSHDNYQLWLAVGHHENRVAALDIEVFTSLVTEGQKMFQSMTSGVVDPNQEVLAVGEMSDLLSLLGMKVIVIDENTNFDELFGTTENKEQTDETNDQTQTNSDTEDTTEPDTNS